MCIARSSCVMVITVWLATGGAVCARAGETEDPRGPRTGCPIVDVMTPGGIVPQVVCGPWRRRGPFGLPPPAQRYPGPTPRSPWPLQYPPLREVGLHVSGTMVTADTFGLVGGSYTRSLTDMFALEGTVDATNRTDYVIGFTSLRALVRQYDPQVGEWFIAGGLARGFSGGDVKRYPHGAGFVVGGGVQPRFSSRAAVRLEGQFMNFSHQMVGVRLTAGILVGFD